MSFNYDILLRLLVLAKICFLSIVYFPRKCFHLMSHDTLQIPWMLLVSGVTLLHMYLISTPQMMVCHQSLEHSLKKIPAEYAVLILSMKLTLKWNTTARQLIFLKDNTLLPLTSDGCYVVLRMFCCFFSC